VKIEINTGTSGDDTVVIMTEAQSISMTVEQARELATTIALVAAQAAKGNDYQEEIEV
jgi:hypothetical protein